MIELTFITREDYQSFEKGARGVMVIGGARGVMVIGGERGEMVIIVGNGHGDTSSNPGRD